MALARRGGFGGAFHTGRLIELARRKRKNVAIRAESGAVHVGGKLRFRRARTAYLQPIGGKYETVSVVGDWTSSCDVTLGSYEEARAFLQALGADPERSVSRFEVAEGIFPWWWAQFALVMTLATAPIWVNRVVPEAWRTAAWLAAFAVAAINWARSTVDVGPDGILVTSPSRLRRTFHPFSEIAEVTYVRGGLALAMKAGRTITLRTAGAGTVDGDPREALGTRIRMGIRAMASATESVDVAALVARGGRPVDEWLRALDAVTTRASNYRVANVPPEKLWRVIEDPTADPTARAGAAAALRASLDEQGRTRLAELAKNSAHPQVRVALDAAAEDDDEALREALESVS